MAYKTFTIEGIGNVSVYKRKGSQSLRLSVRSDGSVRVTIPPWTPYQAGVAFVMARRGWISLHMPQQKGQALVDGQRIGKAHHLSLQMSPESTRITSSIRGTTIFIKYPVQLTANDPAVQKAARAASLRALRHQAAELLGRRLQQLAALHDLEYTSLHIKQMKSRWGSCDQHKNIVLNLFLIQLPWEYIDYVILHELAHTKALHHGPDFWRTLEGLLPRAKTLRKAMKAYQPTLFIA